MHEQSETPSNQDVEIDSLGRRNGVSEYVQRAHLTSPIDTLWGSQEVSLCESGLRVAR